MHARRDLLRREDLHRPVLPGQDPAVGALVEQVTAREDEVGRDQGAAPPAHAVDVAGIGEDAAEPCVPLDLHGLLLVGVHVRARDAERAVVLLDGLGVVGRAADGLEHLRVRGLVARDGLERQRDAFGQRRVQRVDGVGRLRHLAPARLPRCRLLASGHGFPLGSVPLHLEGGPCASARTPRPSRARARDRRPDPGRSGRPSRARRWTLPAGGRWPRVSGALRRPGPRSRRSGR